MKILNLYACLGGNRYKWDEVTDIEVTAVELDPEAARLYQERFPNDKVIVADAHQYLLDHYKEFDFIWSSPPCPTHSRFQISMKTKRKMKYPDMKLYQEIIFLDTFFNGKYCVENVIPYYETLIPAKKRDRHLYWTNFNLPNVLSDRKSPNMAAQKEGRELYKKLNKKVFDVFCEYHDYDFKKYKGKQDVGKMSRNLVDYEAGKTILETAVGIVRKQNVNQTELF
jgi:DNA (cytosine-5)-methyltransferase 1|tara:strand:+ start:234 stop:908 length:675 start_codon:yes stop_codon:yes gene_type:complete